MSKHLEEEICFGCLGILTFLIKAQYRPTVNHSIKISMILFINAVEGKINKK